MYCNRFLNWKFIVIGLFMLTGKGFCADLLSTVDKQSLTVGEILTFQVTAIVPKGAMVIPPAFDKNLGNIVIKEWNTSKKEIDNTDSVTFSFKIATYIPENCTIPSLPFIVQNGDTQDTLFSDAFPLQLQSVIIADSTDTSKIDIKDLRPQLDTGNAPLWWLWILIASLTAAALIIIYKRFFSKKIETEKTIPLLPPYEEAIASINDLERKKCLDRGLIREYVFELSEILKRYIERRFDINASEFTTEEVIAWLGVSGLTAELKDSIQWFFKTSDPIKFARFVPDSSVNDRFMKVTMDFLNATRPLLQENKVPAVTQSDAAKSADSVSDKSDTNATGGNNAV